MVRLLISKRIWNRIHAAWSFYYRAVSENKSVKELPIPHCTNLFLRPVSKLCDNIINYVTNDICLSQTMMLIIPEHNYLSFSWEDSHGFISTVIIKQEEKTNHKMHLNRSARNLVIKNRLHVAVLELKIIRSLLFSVMLLLVFFTGVGLQNLSQFGKLIYFNLFTKHYRQISVLNIQNSFSWFDLFLYVLCSRSNCLSTTFQKNYSIQSITLN